MPKNSHNIFWFRRDLRFEDNTGLSKALAENLPVKAVYIFDTNLLSKPDMDSAKLTFIYRQLEKLQAKLQQSGSSLEVIKNEPVQAFSYLHSKYNVQRVYCNREYEPYARARDESVHKLLKYKGVDFKSFHDQVIFEPHQILKSNGSPYSVFTAYKNNWLKNFTNIMLSENHPPKENNFAAGKTPLPTLGELGIPQNKSQAPAYNMQVVKKYQTEKDFPALEATSLLGPYLRYGTVSIRQVIRKLRGSSESFLSELIWREFFNQILYHHPRVANENYHSKYNDIAWRNNKKEFTAWCEGMTGYPLVDAGMRQLASTGFMHNRVRMITAGFLCKHLLVDWRWGERWFAQKLLDFDLASNNGNWQWAAGTGCDAAPYFRIFNPILQIKRFDKDYQYIKKWVPELESADYPKPIIEHSYARLRALDVYQDAILYKTEQTGPFQST